MHSDIFILCWSLPRRFRKIVSYVDSELTFLVSGKFQHPRFNEFFLTCPHGHAQIIFVFWLENWEKELLDILIELAEEFVRFLKKIGELLIVMLV